MGKVNMAQFSTGPVYMFLVDTKGRIWRRALEGGDWTRAGEIPDEQ